MALIPVGDISTGEIEKVLATEEGYFADIKSLRIIAANLTAGRMLFNTTTC